MKKLIFAAVIALCTITLITFPVSAQKTMQNLRGNSASTGANLQERPSKNIPQGDRQDRARKEINRRLTMLQALLDRINAAEKLNATVKTAVVADIQKEIDALTALQTKFESGTLNTLETDLQSIRNSYQVYALLSQKIHIFVAAEKVLKTADVMSLQAASLQIKITAAQQAGKNVTPLQKLLASMEGNITDAKTQAESAISTITPLTGAGFPANETQLQSARAMVRTGYQSLLAARGDANELIKALKETQSISISVTPQLTCIPRPICLDATPACKIAEPDNGWCPATSNSTSSAE